MQEYTNIITLRLTDGQIHALRDYADEADVSMSDVVREALDTFLSQVPLPV